MGIITKYKRFFVISILIIIIIVLFSVFKALPSGQNSLFKPGSEYLYGSAESEDLFDAEKDNEKSESEKMKIPIIMYHSLQEKECLQNKYSISPEMFENDLRYLKSHGYESVFVRDVIDFVKTGKELPEKPIVLTFDDGFYNNLLYGLPLIKEYDVKVVISIIGKLTDYSYDDDRCHPEYSYLEWDQVRFLVLSGYVEILNHSYDMHKQSNFGNGVSQKKGESISQYEKRISQDIKKMQDLLEDIICERPLTFTYPFGAYSSNTVDILKNLGFEASLACCEGVNYISQGETEKLFNLSRILRPHDISSEKFFQNICN